jgi:serine/threonine-protein kinase
LRICTDPAPIPSEKGRVPSGFDAWFQKAVAKGPAERFQSAGEMAHALREICGGEQDLAVDSSPPTVSSRSGASRTHESFAPTELAEFSGESLRTGSRSRAGWELGVVAALAAVVAAAVIFAVARSNQAESSDASAAQPGPLTEPEEATREMRASPTAEPDAERKPEVRGSERVEPAFSTAPPAASSVSPSSGRPSTRRKAELPSTPLEMPREPAPSNAPDRGPESAVYPSIEEPRKAR